MVSVEYDTVARSGGRFAYTAQGQPIVRSPDGTAGRHLGHEFGTYTGYRYGPFQSGGGFAYLLAGDFIRKTTPGVNTRFWYFYQSFSF